jgi:hypothetical protein
MEALRKIIRRGPYHRYHAMSDIIEPVFEVFATLDPSDYTIQDISDRTGVPARTLSYWRTQVRRQNHWRPLARWFTSNPQMFDDATEARIAAFIREHFISQNRDLSLSVLKHEILMLIHDLIVAGDVSESKLNFKCSTTFLRRFLRRHGLSLRRGRPSRRPNLDDDECFEFLIEFHVSMMSFATSAIVNFDESSWRLVMTSTRTVAERGIETVKRYVDGDSKACFTFFASILADGTKLPLILLAKGKTPGCHKQFGIHQEYEHLIWHSVNGWCNTSLMEDSLRWLRSTLPAAQLVLIMDQFHAHEAFSVSSLAQALGIHLIFIPRGGTGEYQPLDRRTFGALKSIGRARWTTYYAQHPGLKCTRELAAGLLLQCWDELPQSCVLSGWDLEAATDDSISSSSDEDREWELTLDQYPDEMDESDDLDTETSSGDCLSLEDPDARYGYGVR